MQNVLRKEKLISDIIQWGKERVQKSFDNNNNEKKNSHIYISKDALSQRFVRWKLYSFMLVNATNKWKTRCNFRATKQTIWHINLLRLNNGKDKKTKWNMPQKWFLERKKKKKNKNKKCFFVWYTECERKLCR